MLDLENQPGRGDFRQKVLGQDGQNSRSQSRRRRRLNKVHKINGLRVLYHFRATSFLMFIQNRRFGFRWLWSFAIIDMFDILCWIFCWGPWYWTIVAAKGAVAVLVFLELFEGKITWGSLALWLLALAMGNVWQSFQVSTYMLCLDWKLSR